jgi:endoglucanase
MTRSTAHAIAVLVTSMIALLAGAAPAAPVTVADAAMSPLTTKGAAIVRDRKPFHFYGVNRDTLEWGSANWGGCGGDGHFADHDFDVIRSWNVTAVRLPLSQAGWLGRNGCSATATAQWLDAAIAKANARGMYAIVDLHWSDVMGQSPCATSDCPTGQQMMPDADSLVFWRSVAKRYANDPGVVFGLYNEPHDVSWSCWRDGGCTAYTSPYAGTGWIGYTAVGMQQLYNAIRAQGAKNLVLAGGLDWAYDLSGVAAGYALSGTNIAYDTHVYTLWHSTPPDWDAHFGLLAGRYPLVSTEFGSADCTTADSSRLLSYFDAPMGDAANRMSWTIWSWNNPGSCQQPSVIADWEGTPLPGQGEMIKAALATRVP